MRLQPPLPGRLLGQLVIVEVVAYDEPKKLGQ
jgi:hypothetical protein